MNDITIKKDLSNAYKIIEYLKLDDHTYTHLSSRTTNLEEFFIHPFGLRFEEVEATSLMKVDFKGNVIEGNEYQYNRTGYIIHSVIYESRSDIKSIFHIHTPEIVAISNCENGLIPISQWALHFYGKIAYHSYDSLTLDYDESKKLATDLGDKFTMLMRNHGAITCGRTIYEAMFYAYHLQQAAKAQCLSLSLNHKIIVPNDKICSKAVNDLLGFEENLGYRDWLAWIRKISLIYK